MYECRQLCEQFQLKYKVCKEKNNVSRRYSLVSQNLLSIMLLNGDEKRCKEYQVGMQCFEERIKQNSRSREC